MSAGSDGSTFDGDSPSEVVTTDDGGLADSDGGGPDERLDASARDATIPDATGADATAKSGSNDAGSTGSDSGPSSDGGHRPYKGVANSGCSDMPRLNVSWYYNWETTPGCSTAPFVPMVWGHPGAEQSNSGIAGEVHTFAAKGYAYILGFNEPDNASQSNMPVASALALWPSLAASGVKIGSPATQANQAGQAWFKTFMQSVNADATGTLRVDFIAAHWYGWNAGSCDAKASALEGYIGFLEGIPGGRPIWLTEWGCLNQSNPDPQTVDAFFKGAVAMFKRHPRIERYAWYQWEANNELVTSTDALTPLGVDLAAEPAFH